MDGRRSLLEWLAPARPERSRRSSAWRRCALLSLAAALLVAGPRFALAGTTIVPDQYATIQEAVNAIDFTKPTAETLLVRGGEYAEQVLINKNLVVIGIPPTSGPQRLPRIHGLEAGRGLGGEYYEFTGINFTGTVTVGETYGSDILNFRDCQFDGGLLSPGYSDAYQIYLSKCSWTGPVQLAFQEAFLDSCAGFAPVTLYSQRRSVVRSSRFEYVSGAAVRMFYGGPQFEGNLVRGGGIGVVVRDLEYGDANVSGNRFEGCSGPAIYASGRTSNERTYIVGNRILDCAGPGVVVDGLCYVINNEVTGCGGAGLHLTQDDFVGFVERNVVGRCGTGMVVSDGGLGNTIWIVRQNTVYGCSGPGIAIQNEGGATLANNLSVGNLGAGLQYIGQPLPELSCNNWYGNDSGGTPPGSSDLALDPLFCDVGADVVTLRSDSPLLDATGCGRIGARGAGCEPVRSIGLRIASPIVRSNGALQVTFTLPTVAPARLELMDLAGRRLLARDIGSLGPGEHSVDLAEGGPLPSGIYFVRVVQGDQSARARAVFIR